MRSVFMLCLLLCVALHQTLQDQWIMDKGAFSQMIWSSEWFNKNWSNGSDLKRKLAEQQRRYKISNTISSDSVKYPECIWSWMGDAVLWELHLGQLLLWFLHSITHSLQPIIGLYSISDADHWLLHKKFCPLKFLTCPQYQHCSHQHT